MAKANEGFDFDKWQSEVAAAAETGAVPPKDDEDDKKPDDLDQDDDEIIYDDDDIDDEPAPKKNDTPSIEEQARALGWRPQEEWEGEEDGWIDAKEFIGRRPLYEGLSASKREAKALRKQLEAVKKQYMEVERAAYERARKSLEDDLIEAAEQGDRATVQQIRAKQAEMDKEWQSTEAATDNQLLFENWKSENEWFDENVKLRAMANGLAEEYVKDNPDMPLAEVLKKITEDMADEIGAKKVIPASKRAVMPRVSGGGRRTPPSRENKSDGMLTYADLDADQRTVYHQLVKSDKNPHGVISKEKYFQQLTEAAKLRNQRGRH